MSTEPKNDDWPRLKFLCVAFEDATYEGKKGKNKTVPGIRFQRVGDDNLVLDKHDSLKYGLDRKNKWRFSVGSVYSMESKDEEGSSVRHATAQYVTTYPDEEYRKTLIAQAQMKKTWEQAEAVLKKENEKTGIKEYTLEELHEMYDRLPHPRRAGFLAACIYSITH